MVGCTLYKVDLHWVGWCTIATILKVWLMSPCFRNNETIFPVLKKVCLKSLAGSYVGILQQELLKLPYFAIKQSLQCTKFGSRSMFGRFSCVLDLGALITLPSCCNTCERFQITGEQRLSSHCNCNSGNMKQKCFSFQQNLQVSFSQLNLFCEISDFRDNVLISCVNFFINFS